MFTETLIKHDDVIGIACEGKLTESDLQRMHALLHDRLKPANQLSLVVDLTKFEGYESMASLREDLKMDIAHRKDFYRIAVVGDRTWIKWGTMLAGFLTSAEMRWFEKDEIKAAEEWAREA